VYKNTGTSESKHVKNHKKISYNDYNRGNTNDPRIHNRGMRLNINERRRERNSWVFE